MAVSAAVVFLASGIGASPGRIGASPGRIGASPGRIGASPGRIGASPGTRHWEAWCPIAANGRCPFADDEPTSLGQVCAG